MGKFCPFLGVAWSVLLSGLIHMIKIRQKVIFKWTYLCLVLNIVDRAFMMGAYEGHLPNVISMINYELLTPLSSVVILVCYQSFFIFRTAYHYANILTEKFHNPSFLKYINFLRACWPNYMYREMFILKIYAKFHFISVRFVLILNLILKYISAQKPISIQK